MQISCAKSVGYGFVAQSQLPAIQKSKENTTDLHQLVYCYLLFTKIIVEVDRNKNF